RPVHALVYAANRGPLCPNAASLYPTSPYCRTLFRNDLATLAAVRNCRSAGSCWRVVALLRTPYHSYGFAPLDSLRRRACSSCTPSAPAAVWHDFSPAALSGEFADASAHSSLLRDGGHSVSPLDGAFAASGRFRRSAASGLLDADFYLHWPLAP